MYTSPTWETRCSQLAMLCESTGWTSDLETMYQNVAEALEKTFDSMGTYIYLLNSKGTRFLRSGGTAQPPNAPEPEQSRPLSVGRLPWMLKTHEALFTDFEHPHPDDISPEPSLAAGTLCSVSIPLLAQDTLVGFVALTFADHRDWSDDDMKFFDIIGRTLGTAIHRSQMSQKSVELHMLDERRLLSNEIHDNLAQLACTLKLAAEKTLQSWDTGNLDDVRCDLKHLESVSMQTVQSLRDEIMFLRMPLEQADGLIVSLRECLDSFQEHWGIKTELDVHIAESDLIPGNAALQLTRILHEALTNTVRHAQASSVKVTLAVSGNYLNMRVDDDGIGLNLDDAPAGHLGIRIMDERARSMNGIFSIFQNHRGGTSALVQMPLPARAS